MPTIKVVTSDGCIWNREEVLLQVQMANKKDIILDLLSEGPCCQASGIDNLLDNLGVCREQIIINTSNQVSSSRYMEKRQSFVELDLAKQLAEKSQPSISSMKNLFALYVGRSNWQRLGLASYLYRHHYEYSDITYHFDPKLDYHKDNFGLEEYLKRNWTDKSILDFVLDLPIKHNNIPYPILWNQEAFNISDRYKDIFCEIVCETYFSGKTFFVTEKTWRPIINMRPFIVQGPSWYLENLHRLGFKTFGDWWDEGYDEDPSDARLQTLRTNIDWIAGQSRSTLEDWYQEMQPVLFHNLQTLKSLTHSQIILLDFKHE